MGIDERADTFAGMRIRLDRAALQLLVDGQVQKPGGRAFDLLLARFDRRDTEAFERAGLSGRTADVERVLSLLASLTR